MFARGHFLWALCPLGVVIGAAAVASAAPGSRPSLPDSVDSHVVSIMTRIETDDDLSRRFPSLERSRRLMPSLRYMIERRAYDHCLNYTSGLLGLRGDSTDYDRFDRLVRSAFQAKAMPGDTARVAYALAGMAILSDRVPKALAYVTGATNPRFFMRPDYGATLEKSGPLRYELALSAIEALGLSANPRAGAFLKKLQAEYPAFPDRKKAIATALKEHQRTAKNRGR